MRFLFQCLVIHDVVHVIQVLVGVHHVVGVRWAPVLLPNILQNNPIKYQNGFLFSRGHLESLPEIGLLLGGEVAQLYEPVPEHVEVVP